MIHLYDRLIETVLLRGHNRCFCWEIRKNYHWINFSTPSYLELWVIILKLTIRQSVQTLNRLLLRGSALIAKAFLSYYFGSLQNRNKMFDISVYIYTLVYTKCTSIYTRFIRRPNEEIGLNKKHTILSMTSLWSTAIMYHSPRKMNKFGLKDKFFPWNRTSPGPPPPPFPLFFSPKNGFYFCSMYKIHSISEGKSTLILQKISRC